jgi:hypothetical protein
VCWASVGEEHPVPEVLEVVSSDPVGSPGTRSRTQEAASPSSPNYWTARLEIDLPNARHYRIHPATYERVAEALNGMGPVFVVGQRSLAVSFGLESKSLPMAQTRAREAVSSILELMNVPAEAVTGIRLGRGDELSEDSGTVPDCVGLGEAATILGVSKQRVHQLAQRSDFPTPIFRLRATPVWRKAEISDFKRSRERDGA